MAEGLSRRDMIKGAAVAGAAAWTAPMIIDSLTSPAAAASGCQPPASLAISGAAVVYQIGSTIYWTSFASGGTTCLASPTVPSDSDFASPVSACGGTVQVTGGTVLWNGATPAVNATCYFSATANGVSVTSAGISAGVQVLVYVFHNGSFPAQCATYGSKNHWVLLCGSTAPDCGTSLQCITD